MTRRERLEDKLAKREIWADKATARSEQRFTTANQISERFAGGQPILVGHHSEAGARHAVERMDSNMRAGIAESDLASHHAEKASGLARQLDHSIFSDDADAIAALEARIAEREARRDRMKLINSLYRKKDAAGLAALGLDLAALQAEVAKGYSFDKLPYVSWELTNLGATIRTDKERIKEIQARSEKTAKAESAGGVIIEPFDAASPLFGGCSVTFAEKPDRSVINALKEAGFYWNGGSWNGQREKLPEGIVS